MLYHGTTPANPRDSARAVKTHQGLDTKGPGFHPGTGKKGRKAGRGGEGEKERERERETERESEYVSSGGFLLLKLSLGGTQLDPGRWQL